MHLQIARQLRDRATPGSAAHSLLTAAWPAFLLGSVAPDCQSVSDLARETTHFYTAQPGPTADAYALVLERYPSLRFAPAMSAEQAAFVLGYCTHLLYDVVWFRDILIPLFAEQDHWLSHRQRFLAHNALLIHLDRQALSSLESDTGSHLRAATPRGWLPFVPDEILLRWRDEVAGQLDPGAEIQTIAVYARRLGLPAAEYAANLSDPAWMAETIFRRVPLATVEAILDAAQARSLVVLDRYLAGLPIHMATMKAGN